MRIFMSEVNGLHGLPRNRLNRDPSVFRVMMSCTMARMLRRSAATILACATLLALPGCGIKGPLKLPPGETAPAPTGLPPGAVPTTTMSEKPAATAPTPAAAPTPDEDKDKPE